MNKKLLSNPIPDIRYELRESRDPKVYVSSQEPAVSVCKATEC